MKNLSKIIDSPLKNLTISSFIDVEIDIDPRNKNEMFLFCDDKYLEHMHILFSRGDLRVGDLGMDGEHNFSCSDKIKLKITAKTLDSIHQLATGNVSGSYLGKNLFIRLHGAGDICLEGNAHRLQVHISGTGNAELKKLKSSDVEVDISGTGGAIVFASDSIDARVSGTGYIKIYGSPTQKSKKITGTGDVIFVKKNNPKNDLFGGDMFGDAFGADMFSGGLGESFKDIAMKNGYISNDLSNNRSQYSSNHRSVYTSTHVSNDANVHQDYDSYSSKESALEDLKNKIGKMQYDINEKYNINERVSNYNDSNDRKFANTILSQFTTEIIQGFRDEIKQEKPLSKEEKLNKKIRGML